jgi:hypothetical protein
MPYWMTNPEHGVMPVYDMGDVERNKVHGWVLLNEGESPAMKSAEVSADPPQEKRKPGRPKKAA